MVDGSCFGLGVASRVFRRRLVAAFLGGAWLCSGCASDLEEFATLGSQDARFDVASERSCRLLPLGDSITVGDGSSDWGGYRTGLYRRMRQRAQQVTFVGSSENGPEAVDDLPFPRRHEGHCGWTIDDTPHRPGIYPQIEEWLSPSPPEVITLQIGTNDIDTDYALEEAPMRLGLLLDRIAEFAPSALVLVAQIVPTQDDAENVKVEAYNRAIPGLVESRVADGKRLRVVDMYTAFTAQRDYKTELLADKLHPNDAGYAIMANVWSAAIPSSLCSPAANVLRPIANALSPSANEQ